MGALDDMMSSARGPGVIGTLIALLVIVGFGSLFFFVFDEGMSGGKRTIEADIRDNTKEIESLHGRIDMQSKALEAVPELQRVAKETESISSETRLGKGSLDGQTALVTRITAEIQDVKAKLVDYRQRYRNQVRGAAAGVTYPELTIVTNKVPKLYKGVTVTRVDAIGMNFKHSEGSGRANFEDLPESVREQFQYDPEEKALAVQAETKIQEDHAKTMTSVQSDLDEKNRQDRAAAKAKQLQENSAELLRLQGLLDEYNKQVAAVNKAWETDKANVKARGAGIVQGAQYENQLAALYKQIGAANGRISQIKSSLSN